MHKALLSAWGRVLLTAVTMLPLLLIVALSAPAWLLTPFLSDPRRKSVAAQLREIHHWHSDALDRLSRSWQDAASNPPQDIRPRIPARQETGGSLHASGSPHSRGGS
jgi:hypothetical protein